MIKEISEYGMVLSNRTGAFCENKSSSQISEQYAFYYDVKTIKSLDSGNHYPNNDCEYTREPFAARFVSVEFNHTFVLITLHIDPDDVLNETEALVNVFEWAKFQYPGEDDFILLGDLNADCSYARSSELDELAIRNGDYQWIIPDGTNTNTAESSSCAYDRMIIGDGGSDEYLGSFSTDCEVEASDHCIISARFSSMNRVLLAISEYYREPVLTTGVVSVSEHNTTSRLLTIAAFFSSSNSMMFFSLNCSKCHLDHSNRTFDDFTACCNNCACLLAAKHGLGDLL